MTTEELDDVKKDYINNLKLHILENGGMFSHIALFGTKIDTNESAIVHVMVEDQYMTDDGKEKFVNEIAPEMAQQIKKKFSIQSVAWTSEAWLRTADASYEGNWQNIPIKNEALIILFVEKEKVKTIIYNIKRNGKVVNEEGELVDSVELIENLSMEGKPGDKKVEDGRIINLLNLFL